MPEAVPVIVRAGRPCSQEAFVHTLDREHGLHPAKESGKKPCAGLEPAVEPVGGQTRRPVSDHQRHGQRRVGGGACRFLWQWYDRLILILGVRSGKTPGTASPCEGTHFAAPEEPTEP